MGLIKQREIDPAIEFPWASGVTVIATAAIAKLDLIIIDSSTGLFPDASPLDADSATLSMGIIMVATSKAAVGKKFTAVPWALVRNVDTSAAPAAKRPVYADFATAGGRLFAKPTDVNSNLLVVGAVLTDHATTGSYLLMPNSTYPMTLQKVFRVKVLTGTTSITKAIGDQWSYLHATEISTPSNPSTIIRAVMVGADATVTVSVNPGVAGLEILCTAYHADIVEDNLP